MKALDRKETFDLVWKVYRLQKDEEARAGINTEGDINRMRAWLQENNRGPTTHQQLEDKFGPDDTAGNPALCSRCGGEGWYHSQKAQMRRRTPKGDRIVEVPGMVVCTCPSGRMKNDTIRKHGRVEKKKPTRGY